MNKKNWQDKKKNRTKSGIEIVIAVFLGLILLISFPGEKESFWNNYAFIEGRISITNIYSPLDYSFIDGNGQKIDVKKDELIVQRGAKINKTQQAALFGLKKIQKQPKKRNYFLGIFLLLIIFSVITTTYLSVYSAKIIFDLKSVFLLCLLTFFIILATKVIVMTSWPLFLIPLASVSMLIAILMDPGISLMLTLVLSVFIGVLTGVRFDIVGMMLAGSVVSIYSVLNLRKRGDLTKAGVLIGLTNMVFITGLGLVNFVPFTELVIQAGWGLANGIISAIIVAGILPVFEILFQISTNISLLELSDLNQPLLKEMVLKAPGTYHHSLVVGNLAESAAEAVGANSLLARVGAYFHDIGKLRMADYFSENQPHEENKHENLSPTISSLIIINHIKEGMDLAKRHRLGKKILDIIEQHHGDDVVFYFYHRALVEGQTEDKGKIQEEDFRYPGPKPQSKEAAIVMLADAVEAASRTIAQPAPAKIEELVKRIINNKFIDGQLDECDLTLKDLHIIFDIFTHILNGIFHSRVQYPALNQVNEQNKNKESPEKNKSQSAETEKTGE